MDFPLMISLLAFLMCMLGSLAVYTYMDSRRAMDTWRRRVENKPRTETVQQGGWASSAKGRIGKLLERLGRANQPKSQAEMLSLRQALVAAGYRHPRAPILFLGAKLLGAVIAVVMLALIPPKWLGFPSHVNLLLFYVGAASLGYFAPAVWLRRAIASRQRQILLAMPDALDLMVVCVEAGLGLDQAINRVGEEIKLAHPALSDEFHVLGLELRTGVARVEALKNFARRIDLEEIKSLVALLIQTDRFGTSIGQALRVHSDSMKVSRQMRAEELAAKLPVKLLFPLIFFIFPSLFIAVLGPAVIRIARILLPALAH